MTKLIVILYLIMVFVSGGMCSYHYADRTSEVIYVEVEKTTGYDSQTVAELVDLISYYSESNLRNHNDLLQAQWIIQQQKLRLNFYEDLLAGKEAILIWEEKPDWVR